MATISGPIIGGCWIIFIVYWLISAFGQKAAAEAKSFRSSLPYRIPLMVGAVLLWVPRFHRPLNMTLTPHTHRARLCGAGVCVLGLLVTIWARWTLAGNWSSEVAFKKGHELVKTGPYSGSHRPEARSPKFEGRKKAEIRNPKGDPRDPAGSGSIIATRGARAGFSAFGFRTSAFFRPSGLGFRIWGPRAWRYCRAPTKG